MSSVRLERQWKAHGLDCLVLWIDTSYGDDGGHRTGYVRVPNDHPFHGKNYRDDAGSPADVEDRTMDDAGMAGMIAALGGPEGVERYSGRVEAHVGVHGGLTYADEQPTAAVEKGWWFGFDCAHLDDRASHWTEGRVAAEVERLAAQLAAIEEKRAQDPEQEKVRTAR